MSDVFRHPLTPTPMIIRQLPPDDQPRIRFDQDAIYVSLINDRIPDFFTAYDDEPVYLPIQSPINATPGGR